MCYGCDWNLSLLISGIWLPAYIELRAEDYINCCEPKYDLDIEKLTAKIKFDISCSVQPKITLSDPDGKVIYTGYENTILLENVRLWWCNGQGEPELYCWKAETPNDVKEGKQTIIYKYAIDHANCDELKIIDKYYGNPNISVGETKMIADLFEKLGAKRNAEKLEIEYTNKGIQIINSMDVQNKDLFMEFANYLLKRDK